MLEKSQLLRENGRIQNLSFTLVVTIFAIRPFPSSSTRKSRHYVDKHPLTMSSWSLKLNFLLYEMIMVTVPTSMGYC